MRYSGFHRGGGRNNLADALAKLGSSLRITPEEPMPMVWLQYPYINTIGKRADEMFKVVSTTDQDWRAPLLQVLRGGDATREQQRVKKATDQSRPVLLD